MADTSGTPLGVTRRAFVIRDYRGDGTAVAETPLGMLEANIGTRPEDLFSDRPRIVTTIDASPDGSTLFVGWAYRQPDSWRAGVWVVDVARNALAQTLDLPPISIAPLEVRDAEAPQVEVSPGASEVVVRYRSYTDRSLAPYQRWSAPFAGGLVGALLPMTAQGPGTLNDISCSNPQDEGFATDASYYAVCTNDMLRGDILVLRRVQLDDAAIGDTPLAQMAPHGLMGTGFALDRSTSTWYGWSPFGHMVGRVDLTTGVASIRTLELPTGSAGDDWLGRFGWSVARWLVPVASAKSELAPSLAISPAGDRLYALGVGQDVPGESVGSGGVVVIDTATLGLIAHWPPTADYWSIAVSADGSWVYAAGMGGVDAAGQASALTQSSLTVHASSDGKVRLRLPGLGSSRSYRLPAATAP